MSIQPNVCDPIMLPRVQAAADGQKSELILPSKIQVLADNNMSTQLNKESHNRDWRKSACKAESSTKNTLIKVLFASAVLLGVGLILLGSGCMLFSPTLPQSGDSLTVHSDFSGIRLNSPDQDHFQNYDTIRMKKRLGWAPDFPGPKTDLHELLQLQRNLSDTHYVFSHGLSRTQAKITRLISDLDHRLWPKRDAKGFIFSRVVPSYKIGIPLKEILFTLNSFNDQALRSELLSVDADLLNTEFGESALAYYFNNENAFNNLPWIICDVFKKFSEEFSMDFFEEACLPRIESLKKNRSFNHELGNILVYAVPKNLVHNPETNFIYTSLSYGEPVDKGNPLARLDELVKEPESDTGISVRLITSHLKPENGIKSFLIGKISDKGDADKLQTKEYGEIAEVFYQQIFNHCHTCKLPNPFSKFPEPLNAQCERLVEELSM